MYLPTGRETLPLTTYTQIMGKKKFVIPITPLCHIILTINLVLYPWFHLIFLVLLHKGQERSTCFSRGTELDDLHSPLPMLNIL